MKSIDITEHIRNKIREVLLLSLPNDELDTMIQAEYDAMFATKESRWGREPSWFSQQVQEQLREKIKERIRLWLDQNFEDKWDESCGLALVGDLVAEFTPVVLQRLAGDMASRALAEIRGQL